MNSSNPRQEAINDLGKKIKDIHIAMLTTQESDGTLRSRPMATQQVEFDGDLWFFTQASAPKVDEMQQQQHVNVSYADTKNTLFVSVSGTAALVRDRQKIKELWNPLYKVWFPNGQDDPDIALLKVQVTDAEYWDSPSNKMVQIAGFAKALITGDHEAVGHNEKLDLH